MCFGVFRAHFSQDSRTHICNADLGIDVHGIDTCFDVNCQYYVYCCAAQSRLSLDDVATAAATFSNLNAQSFHDAALESKHVVERGGGSGGNASESDWHALKLPRTQRRRGS